MWSSSLLQHEVQNVPAELFNHSRRATEGRKPQCPSALLWSGELFLDKLAELHLLPPWLRAGWASDSTSFSFKRHYKREICPRCLTWTFFFFLIYSSKQLEMFNFMVTLSANKAAHWNICMLIGFEFRLIFLVSPTPLKHNTAFLFCCKVFKTFMWPF